MLLAFLWGGFTAASLLIGSALAWRGLSHRGIGIVMGIGSGPLIGLFTVLGYILAALLSMLQ